MQPTSLRVYFNFQSNKKFFRNYFSTRLVSGGPPTRGRFVSRSFSATSYVSAISHGTSVTPSAIFPSWSFPIAHHPLLPLSTSPLVLIVSLQILRTFYTTYLPLSATVTFAHVVILPSSHTTILICPAKFSEKMTVPSPDT